MKSSIYILSALYELINVPEVKDIITGKVYVGDVPDGSQLENISLKSLANQNAYLQKGYANLNVYVPEVISGRADIGRFNQLTDIIMPIVKDAQKNGVFFQIDDDKGIFKDQDTDSMYFYNLKLIFQTI